MSGSRMNNVADMTIREQIEDVCNKICKDYCQYPAVYHKKYLADVPNNPYETEEDAYDAMVHEVCVNCPLTRL